MSAVLSNAADALPEVVDDKPFFAPCASDLIDILLGQYQSMRRRIESVGAMVTGETAGAIQYFLDGNPDTYSRYAPPVSSIFKTAGAIAALNAAYWSKTLSLTDVYDCMPQARRDEWNNSIKDMSTPDFTEDAVRPTIAGLLAMRHKFLAERVDGIFRGLSGEHVTNAPQGFGKRMIIAYVLSDYHTVSHGRAGLINDLRCVIAKFMGRDEPKYYASARLIETLKCRWGEWVAVDGGALRVRLYKKGTAHLEVHPDMAWRLNQILAHLYPMAIPAEFRAKPKREAKDFAMIGRPLPFAVIEVLAEARKARRGTAADNELQLAHRFKEQGSAAWDEAARVLQSIGGAQTKPGLFSFDYYPGPVLDEIVISGCIPDKRAHQFYPTPARVAEIAVEMAAIGEADTVLEPSAGQGDLAAFLPKDRTTCVEISALHCDILRARGFAVTQGDFLAWSGSQFDRIVMNPPFSSGRARLHVEHAFALLKPGGRLVAVLPASERGKPFLPGAVEWSSVIDNAFAGTSVSVVVMAATKGELT